ncbi:MAG TPA: CPBP family glutamic-type intramembrane protease [Anoxybacillus sp.]|jgi:hypothetical protein|nr:CPBP family glutamic-type intramembrane protease [Anoxybacillus sp.]
MDKHIVQYVFFLLFVLVFTVYWGKAMTLCKNSKFINSFTRFLMRYSRSQFDPIKFYTMMVLYAVISLMGTIILHVAFGFNIFRYLPMEVKYIVYIFIDFVAQLSLSSMILFIISAVKTNINWFKVIQEITWVNLMSNMPKALRPIYPLLGASFEEIFFRGTVFMIHITYFPEMGIILPIILVTGFFVLQQMLNTETTIQGVVISIGAIVISVIGCLLILYTGSFLPSLICHLLFVIFYLGGSDSRETSHSM